MGAGLLTNRSRQRIRQESSTVFHCENNGQIAGWPWAAILF